MQKQVKPEIGMGCSMRVGSDWYPFHIQSITTSGKTLYCVPADTKPAAGYNYYTNQVWEYTPGTGNRQVFTLRKDGYYRQRGSEHVVLSIGECYKRIDPDF